MKKNYLLLMAILMAGFAAHAQESASSRQVRPLKSEATKARTEVVTTDTLAGETIEHLDAVILAIDHKVEYVRNDRQQHEKALETGWYDKMAASRARLIARREALVQRGNTH